MAEEIAYFDTVIFKHVNSGNHLYAHERLSFGPGGFNVTHDVACEDSTFRNNLCDGYWRIRPVTNPQAHWGLPIDDDNIVQIQHEITSKFLCAEPVCDLGEGKRSVKLLDSVDVGQSGGCKWRLSDQSSNVVRLEPQLHNAGMFAEDTGIFLDYDAGVVRAALLKSITASDNNEIWIISKASRQQIGEGKFEDFGDSDNNQRVQSSIRRFWRGEAPEPRLQSNNVGANAASSFVVADASSVTAEPVAIDTDHSSKFVISRVLAVSIIACSALFALLLIFIAVYWCVQSKRLKKRILQIKSSTQNGLSEEAVSDKPKLQPMAQWKSIAMTIGDVDEGFVTQCKSSIGSSELYKSV